MRQAKTFAISRAMQSDLFFFVKANKQVDEEVVEESEVVVGGRKWKDGKR